MKNCIIIISLLFISSFEFSISYRKRNHHFDERLEQLLDILKLHFTEDFDETITFDANNDNNPDSVNTEPQVDPNDRVNVELWNRLNAEDEKRMPTIIDYSDEVTATAWLKWYLRIAQRHHQVSAHLHWNYETNITKENQKLMTAQSLLQSPFSHKVLPIAKKFNENLKESENDDLKRIFGRLATGVVSDNMVELKQASRLHAQLENIYAVAKVCESSDPEKCYALSPYLERVMQVEKDYDRLTWAWKGWHDECGNKVRPVYLSYIDLLNKNIKENGYTDLSEYWIKDYEMGGVVEFEGTIDQLLKDIMPLYEQLHAYVRGRLCSMYPNRFSCNGPIPAHILGNMWAQTWHDRFDDLMPYPDAPLVNITEVLLEKKFTTHQMYTTSESFFTSIGLYPMTPKFWARSLFTKPTDRDVVCHPAASDMGYHDDYRVKICTEIDDDYFYTIHHEMGHVEYYMAYGEKQSFAYRDGANSGFHEAIGDTIGMYAISPSHLIKLGFLDEEAVNQHYEINYLFRLALQKVAFLPFGYIMDKYRFLLFRGKIDREHELNSRWWALRVYYGGVMAAVDRSDEVNFDAGAKYHIPSNVPYLRYFIAHILQFQFYRAMCRLQGVTERLHMCDIYGNKFVGAKFKEMLAMGSSKSWQDILKVLTGEDRLESKAILDFFSPLHTWLKAENLARGYPVGWM
ncbi:unnamed protein product [Rotaria socialis]|uniref:Angiotensin-converting enzyme n=1 Tax=Rotaria socialis TaxID=392032 RepID=A0A820H2T5_9BILA|nr:unnamed protein product [Rotaria socialis]CAF3522210.1 unnamed protein product [Rotaria socialis]CAF4163484.1 unnamed protein product [Rotaria socialis]CAF4288291.1 unnamed protein product [Rotaria socialis]